MVSEAMYVERDRVRGRRREKTQVSGIPSEGEGARVNTCERNSEPERDTRSERDNERERQRV